MALRYLKDSLPWLVPSAAIAFAAYVLMDRDFDLGPAAPVQEAVAPAVETDNDVVARQATPDSSLTAVAAAAALAQPEPVAVETPKPQPEPAPVRQAALTTAPVFDTSGFQATANRQCVEDLRNMAAEARVYFPSGGLTADAAGIEQGRLLGQIAQNCPGVQIRVDGHSDPSGDPAANLRLSEARAQEVIQRIGAGGIDTTAFFARGVGDREPSGRVGPRPSAFYDRRVEFTIVEEVTRVAVRTTVAARPWANASCVADLQRAVDSTVLIYAPQSVSLRPDDLDTAMTLADHAQARVRAGHGHLG
ncbi:MAG: OmpA family protein, partial [Pseudomonadota bacterium]